MFGNNSNFSNSNPFGAYTPQGYQPQQTQSQAPAKLESLDELLSGSGAKSFFNADSQPGQSVTGVLDLIETSQMRDFQTKQPAYWNDGRPQMQIHIVLQTTLHDPSIEDDDGRRSLWIKGWGIQLKAFREACRQAGVKAPKQGDTITATFTGLGERGNAPQAPKVYAYQITPSNSVAQLVNPQLAQTAPQQPVGQFPQQPAQSSQQQPQPRQQYAPPQQPMGQYQPQQPVPPQMPVQQAPQQYQQQTPTPQQPAYQQPTAPQQPQQPAPVQAPQASVQQIQQLRSLGKKDQEIAGLLGVTIQQIGQIAGSPVTGSEDTPDF
jgi:hypothetical protein